MLNAFRLTEFSHQTTIKSQLRSVCKQDSLRVIITIFVIHDVGVTSSIMLSFTVDFPILKDRKHCWILFLICRSEGGGIKQQFPSCLVQ